MMNTLNPISFTGSVKYWLLILPVLLLFLLSSCSSSSSGGSPSFTPLNTLEGSIFILGSQIDNNGDLVVFMNGTDIDGTPLSVTDLQSSKVTVGTSPTYTNNDPELDIAAVSPGDSVLSLSLVVDYSSSTNNELDNVAAIYRQMLDNLPLVFEAQVITFSNTYDVKLDWTDASSGLAAIKDAVGLPHDVRDKTALYDTMGFALEGDLQTAGDGLVERCRPAHMLVVFTDGEENYSSVYTDKNTLTSIINNSRTVVIMLGTSTASQAELLSLAGDYGAVVQVSNSSGLVAEANSWSTSLQSMVKLTLKASTGFVGKTVSIAIGSQTATVVDPGQPICPP